MGFTKWELVQFFDGLTELVSDENKGKARVQIRKFLLEFEKSYQYEGRKHSRTGGTVYALTDL